MNTKRRLHETEENNEFAVWDELSVKYGDSEVAGVLTKDRDYAEDALILKESTDSKCSGNPFTITAQLVPEPSSFADTHSDQSGSALSKKVFMKRLDDEPERPPITLLCKEFFEFDRTTEYVRPEREDCLFVKRICYLMGGHYYNEGGRLRDFVSAFKEYSGNDLTPSDISGGCQTKGNLRHGKLPLYCTLDVKFERGRGSTDGYMQIISYYWKSFEDKIMENLQYPCLSKCLNGYMFSVDGIVNTDQGTVASHFFKGNEILLRDRKEVEIYKFAQLFKSIKLFLDALKSNTNRPAASAFPFVVEFEDNDGKTNQLHYIRDINSKAFVAEINNSDAKVVAKFTTSVIQQDSLPSYGAVNI
jgi:hypothetical protein